MKLHSIDKALYRKRLNRILVTSVVILLAVSLTVSNALIAVYGSDVSGDNFGWNVAGVVCGVLVLVVLFKLIEKKPFMFEINYVRGLKREMNRIYRSSKKLLPAIEANNEKALIISYFNLQASKQVYELDNNTLTMDELNEKIRLLDEKIVELGLQISVEDYQPSLIAEV